MKRAVMLASVLPPPLPSPPPPSHDHPHDDWVEGASLNTVLIEGTNLI